jgi:hypothetical protein
MEYLSQVNHSKDVIFLQISRGRAWASATTQAQSLRGLPAETGHELARVDSKAIGKSKQTRQAEVALATFHFGDEREVESDRLCEGHLAEPHLNASRAGSAPQLHLRRATSTSPSHARQPTRATYLTLESLTLNQLRGTRGR